MINRIFISLVICLLAYTGSYGQDNSGTPYSLYGFGLLPENIGPYTAMGGVAAAMRDQNNINFLNPASYTALDSNRFYFQFAMTGEYTHISTYSENSDYRVAQNSSFNMAFRIWKNLYSSLGFSQKSDIGYDLNFRNIIPGSDYLYYSQKMQGEGGLNEVYLGLAWRYKNLSIGLNSSLIFGKIEQRQTLQTDLANSYYINTSDNIRITDALFTGGLQYLFNISKKSKLTLGTAFNFGTDLRAKQEYISYKINSGTGSSVIMDNDENVRKGDISYPFRILSGFNYDYKDRWNVAGDYTYQKMSEYKMFRRDQGLKDYHKAALGLSWLPERMGRFWWQRNKYMLGGYFVRSYIDLKNKNINTYAFTFGAQMPIFSANSELLLGINFDFGIRGTEERGLIQEKFGKIRINIAFKEGWFMKRKIN